MQGPAFCFQRLMRDRQKLNPSRIMIPIETLLETGAAPAGRPSLRISPENSNHHLWNNHGTWFLHYTIHPTPITKQRVRRSLGTKDLDLARRRRDLFLAALGRSRDP